MGGADPWERKVVDRIAAGDPDALREVYDRYSSLVFGLALRTTNDRQTAADLTQEVFVSLWSRPERFDPARGTLQAFLAVMTRNRGIDLLRSHGAAARREERHAVESPAIPAADVADAASDFVVAELVREAVDALPTEQREAIQLAYFGGHTYREVATLLGIPEGTAKSRLRIGLQRLADALSAKGVVQWA
jgi:RNA polymerase sigma-70 factor (ECF subfamily)